ncbi:MAG TPA: hypothetical protein VLG76_08025 [Rhabdochlamydiaceae bacterium]|nr:hypothetical protein [Rhabdochlamydiaceae bacterium]
MIRTYDQWINSQGYTKITNIGNNIAYAQSFPNEADPLDRFIKERLTKDAFRGKKRNWALFEGNSKRG